MIFWFKRKQLEIRKMSNPFGNFGGIVIHQDISENVGGQAMRKTKREDLQGKPPANKRAALGTITNTTRIQPSRAAKQVSLNLV